MQSKLSRICDAIIEAGWLVALVVAPLFFNTFSSRVFEPDKIHLARSIAVLMAVAWLVQLIDGAFGPATGGERANVERPALWSTIKNTPLVLPALLLVLSYLISTAFSLAPRISLFGSYVRLQGTLTFLAYVVIFGAVLSHLRTRRQVNRILHAVIITSLPIAMYGIIQNAGLDPLPWGGDVRERVAGNMGNAIFIAAYLIIAVFLTLERLIDSMASLVRSQDAGIGDALRAGAYLFVLVLQFTAIVFSQSRGPQLGLAAGLYVFGMLGLLLLARWGAAREAGPAFLRWLSSHVRAVWLGLIGVTVGGLLLMVVMNVPNGPLAGLCDVRYIGRTCTIFNADEGTNAVRALIWEGVVDLMTPGAALETPDGRRDAFAPARLLLGYGPESLWVAFNRFYPPELGHFESRSASPDRSHNETFDALARGGLLQLAAEVFLFGSFFYYALRWLGLIRGRRDRNLFIAFLVGGGALGIVLPLIFDGSLRFAGIGWPAGLIVGLILYVTVVLVFGGRVTTVVHVEVGDPRAQLLIVAIFAAIVAHFVELHFGIAIVSTMTHLWILAAVLVAVGMGWVREEVGEAAERAVPAPVDIPAAAPQLVRAEETPRAVLAAQGTGGSGRSAAQSTRSQSAKRKDDPRGAGTPASAQRRPDERRSDGQRTGGRAPVRAVAAPVVRHPVLTVLPHAMIMAIISAVFVWDYTVNQTGATGASSIFWNSFTTRVRDGQVLSSPMILILVLFTWLVGGITAIGEAREEGRNRFSVLSAALLYVGVAAVTFVVYGLIHASRMNIAGLDALGVVRRTVGHLVAFDVVLILLGLGLAVTLILARPQPWPARFAQQPAVSLAAGTALAALAIFLIVSLNIRTVQADTYFKQAGGYEGIGQWEGAVLLYREAAELQPQEDYYYLFLGRALLQLSDQMQTGAAILPEDLSNVPTERLLGLVDQAIQTGNREDMLRAAHAVLVGARRLNPYNTDHSANLARLFRAWAFTGAVAPGESGDPDRLREVLQQNPEQVNQARLQQSVDYYGQALLLSPNNAGLWNELATVQYIQGDLAAARATLEQSLKVDDRYFPTHLLLGDVLMAQGDRVSALAAYKQAAEVSPKNLNVLSAIGMAGVDAGDPQAATDAWQRIVDIETAAANSAQAQLDRLSAQAASRAALEQQVTQHRRQVFAAYRNLAFVLQSMARDEEALVAAQQALALAPESERAELESFIASIQGAP